MIIQDSALIETNIDSYLERQERKSLLRFITCGSVDDGKSTLIGRLLYDSRMIFEDQLAALEADSKKLGTQGGDLDFALLVDGLAAEREQGITIDVAYRFFSTAKRKFIVADTPGHEQYTRNMVTGASTADLAVILIDARKGVLTQTRRHSYLASLVGIRQVVLAVNKMDLVEWSERRFDTIVADYRAFTAAIGLSDIVAIPLSGLRGDNVAVRGASAPWYGGPSLLEHLETVPLAERVLADQPFQMPVQWVNRPNLDFRGFAGLIAAGSVRPGDEVRVLPSGRRSTVTRIVTQDGDLGQATAGLAVTLTLTDEIDISRGDVLCAKDSALSAEDQFEATLVWMGEADLQTGRHYWLKLGAKTVAASVAEVSYKIDVNTLERQDGPRVGLNEIAICRISLAEPVAFIPYADNRTLGGFILIDRIDNATVAAGMIRPSARQSRNLGWELGGVTKAVRAAAKGQKPAILWFTGLSGAGKSTIAGLVEKKLLAHGKHTFLLDGDNIRHGLCRDLGFSDEARVENVRRVAEVAKLMVEAGLIVLVSFISPFRAERQMARSLVDDDEFFEIFIDTPLSVSEARDVKGLYKKARQGEIKHFTGIDSPYEAPEAPDVHIDTTACSAAQAAEIIFNRVIGPDPDWSV